jgi:hypothetical protein
VVEAVHVVRQHFSCCVYAGAGGVPAGRFEVLCFGACQAFKSLCSFSWTGQALESSEFLIHGTFGFWSR